VERLRPVIRISAGLVLLTCSILVILDLVGVLPPAEGVSLGERVRICESLASDAGAALSRNDLQSVRTTLELATRRNPEILSAGLRGADRRLLLATRDHQELWKPERDDGSTATHVRVPIFREGARWATLEVRFRDPATPGLLASLRERPLVRLVAWLSVLCFVAYLLYMRRTLRHLDPSSVIPARVQAALDVMTEGILLLDDKERIVLANAAFAERLGRSPRSLLGVEASSLGWKPGDPAQPAVSWPWVEAIREGRTSTGCTIEYQTPSGESRVFLVNGSPVLDGWGRPKGAIATFDDVTTLQAKTAELEKALSLLEKSQDEVRLQNEELQVLARRDPLTGVSNRRAFLEQFSPVFSRARERRRALCCVMGDIDHFKRINDAHGHAAGDEVIRRIAEVMTSVVGSHEMVCRWGGEEFCIALPGHSLDSATAIAEQLHRKIQLPGFARVPVTASFGVASLEFGAATLIELIDQADEALYCSKRTGRNRVTRWDRIEAIGA
jgi:diguanylate cyclase (GGDEF)-like protein/PAS domain S-box-containing protein